MTDSPARFGLHNKRALVLKLRPCWQRQARIL
jgi:hypothetical protein